MPNNSVNEVFSVPPSFDEKLAMLATPLKELNEKQARNLFSLGADARLLKTTLSLCDVCLVHAPAVVYALHGKVFITSKCTTHGLRKALLENDENYYRLSNKDQWGRAYVKEDVVSLPSFKSCCGSPRKSPSAHEQWLHDFSDQRDNKTCTVLVEITDACNLACRVCYADSKGDRLLPFARFQQHLLALLDCKGGALDSVQITGGEASIHPQFWEMLHWLHSLEGIGKIYLPTNGLEFAKANIAKRLKPYRDKLLVLLQFDGKEVATNRSLRSANPLKPRLRLIKALDRCGVCMQFTMTLARGVSEKEIEWVVQQGIKHKHVRVIGMLPTFFSGRYQLAQDPLNRLTLSDVAKGVANAFPSYVKASDFLPIPCSHPNCGWTTLFARRFGLFFNIARHIDLAVAMDEVAYKTILDKRQMQGIIGTRYGFGLKNLIARVARRLIRPKDVFGIAIKPFMDRFNYDQDRVSACCHHMLDTEGQLVSFCEYNARLRSQDSWQKFPSVQASTRRRQVVKLE